ncbi:hypothetical protein P9112_014583 [Eukaryota sp. TZLM1-RC]
MSSSRWSSVTADEIDTSDGSVPATPEPILQPTTTPSESTTTGDSTQPPSSLVSQKESNQDSGIAVPVVTYPATEPSKEEEDAALEQAETEARQKFGNLTTNVAAFQRRKLRKRFDSADFFKQK